MADTKSINGSEAAPAAGRVGAWTDAERVSLASVQSHLHFMIGFSNTQIYSSSLFSACLRLCFPTAKELTGRMLTWRAAP